ncbi:hypothetical protein M231_04330 [Tremella mesenterica]|uniref:Uncharacterized protein n=1 Tax=Tremella mesenterica TaxID=5217 RepID=A0A4Q1BKW1_TREME|nr:hypothetical protein M231_04330 [Tremella mesenterica]
MASRKSPYPLSTMKGCSLVEGLSVRPQALNMRCTDLRVHFSRWSIARSIETIPGAHEENGVPEGHLRVPTATTTCVLVRTPDPVGKIKERLRMFHGAEAANEPPGAPPGVLFGGKAAVQRQELCRYQDIQCRDE